MLYLLKLNSVSTTLESAIFKTIKDDATGAADSISIFNSSVSTIKENLSNKQGIFYSLFQGNKLKSSDIGKIEDYAKALDSGVNKTEAAKSLEGCSQAALKYVADAQKAKKSTEQMVAGLEEVPKAGNGVKNAFLNITSTIGNMAAGMLVGVAINLIIAGITNLVKAADEAKKKAVENARSSILCTPSGITISVSLFTFVYFFNTPLLI